MNQTNKVTPTSFVVVLVIAAIAAIGGVSYFFWSEDILGADGWPVALSLGIMCILAFWAGRFWVESEQVVPRNRIMIASLTVGLVGALIAGYWGYSLWQAPEISGELMPFPIGIVSGFLSCFFISIWYLKFMEHRSWRWGILFGLLFAGLAGAISGVMTGIANLQASGYILGTSIGLIFGVLHGLAIGLISGLIFGATRGISTRMKG